LELELERERGIEMERERERERGRGSERNLAAGLGALGFDLGALGTIGAICALGSVRKSLFLRDLRVRLSKKRSDFSLRGLRP
jgi:hypothetical protein